MSKRPPSRRVVTRKAVPTPVHLDLSNEDHEDDAEPVADQPPPNTDQPQQPVPSEEPESTENTDTDTTLPQQLPEQSDPPDESEPTEQTEPVEIDDTEDTPQPTEAFEIPEGLTTTSFITTPGAITSTTTDTPHRRKRTKSEIFSEYVYGRREGDDIRVNASLLRDTSPLYRHNRTYDMRKTCNAKRMDFSRLVVADEQEEGIRRSLGQVPAHLLREPKIAVRHTLGSKFRYLYNRRPPGVKVYFKSSKDNPNERPPFISATRI